MPKSRHRKHAKRAKRPSYQPGAATSALQSDLGKEQWAMVTSDERLIHFGCTYDEARDLAQKHNGMVMTDAAANRIRSFNELAAADSRG